TSLDPLTVVEMTVNGALEALPIQSCEVYIFDEEHKWLRRAGTSAKLAVEDDALHGPEAIFLDNNPTLVEVLRSPGLIIDESRVASSEAKVSIRFAQDDIRGPLRGASPDTSKANSLFATRYSQQAPAVLLGRLMGSEEALGILRLTTTLPPEEFVHRHATFCQTLLTHSGGALERSRLYTTTA